MKTYAGGNKGKGNRPVPSSGGNTVTRTGPGNRFPQGK